MISYFKKIVFFSFIFLSCAPPAKEVVQPKFKEHQQKNIFYHLDSLCEIYNISGKFVYDIGKNESGWSNQNDLTFVQKCGIKNENSYGDLQLNEVYLIHINALNDTTDRIKLLSYGVKYLSELYHKHKDYKKVRFIYGRGQWKDPAKWSKIERRFMNMDWNKY